MHSKKEYLILGLIIISALVYLYKHQQDKLHYQLPVLQALSVSKVDKIKINNKTQEIVLQKSDDGTWLLGDKKYKANPDKVDQILRKVSRVKLNTLISTSKNYERYHLDNKNGIKITLFSAGDKPLRTLVVGKTAPTYSNSYALIDNDPNIYLTDKNLKYDLDVDLDTLRDKKVFFFTPDKIKKIVLTKGIKKLSLQKKTNATQIRWSTAEGQPADHEKIKDLIDQCQELRCVSFLDKKKKTWKTADYGVHLKLVNGQSRQLLIFVEQSDKQDKDYYGISSLRQYPFELPQYTTEKMVQDIDSLFSKQAKADNEK